jgi:NADH:ubiquinone oxidoreductase subunit 2 (subunit N)
MEFIIKYFLIQRITSVILVVLCSIYFNLFFFVIIILLKIGIPPFHLWVLDILKIETQ